MVQFRVVEAVEQVGSGAAVEKQTPSFPVNFVYPDAAVAAASLWRQWM